VVNQTLEYSLVIEWSPEDQAYVVVLSEWADQYAMPVAHGSVHDEAAKGGRDALENAIRVEQEEGDPLPQPRGFAGV